MYYFTLILTFDPYFDKAKEYQVKLEKRIKGEPRIAKKIFHQFQALCYSPLQVEVKL